MKLVGIISTAFLFLLFGTTAPAYAQHEENAQEAKPAQHAQQKQEARPAKPAQHAQQKQEARPAKSSQHADQKQEAQQAMPAQHAQQQQHAQQPQRVAGNRGGRIPDDRFRAHFGRDHRFRVNRPTIVAGYPRFQYGGYWFGFVDPWPADWYYTDDVYVDYIDGGYYLYNPARPGVRIAISVVIQ
jgi:flagellar motor protein MotB